MPIKFYIPIYIAVTLDLKRAVYLAREAQCILGLQAHKDWFIAQGRPEDAAELQRAIDDFYNGTQLNWF